LLNTSLISWEPKNTKIEKYLKANEVIKSKGEVPIELNTIVTKKMSLINSANKSLVSEDIPRPMETIKEVYEDYPESDVEYLNVTDVKFGTEEIEFKVEEAGLGSAALSTQLMEMFENMEDKKQSNLAKLNEELSKQKSDNKSSSQLMKILFTTIEGVETELANNFEMYRKKFEILTEELTKCREEVLLL